MLAASGTMDVVAVLSLRTPLCPPRCLFLPPQYSARTALSCLDLLAAGVRHLGHGRWSSIVVRSRSS